MNQNAEDRLMQDEPEFDPYLTVVDTDTRGNLNIVVRPSLVAKWLALLVLVVVILGIIANIVIYNVAPSTDHALAKFMNRFDLGHEPSIPSWYSSIALLASSVLLAIIARAERLAGSVDQSRWILLSFVFLVLAADEAVMIHEMADAPLHQLLNSSGLFYFAWVIPYSIGVILLGGFLMPFLFRLDKRTRRLFVVSAVMFVFGAIGIEMIEGTIVDELGVEGGFVSMRLTFAQALEEALEMFAVVLFIYALLDYLKRYVGSLKIESP